MSYKEVKKRERESKRLQWANTEQKGDIAFCCSHLKFFYTYVKIMYNCKITYLNCCFFLLFSHENDFCVFFCFVYSLRNLEID